MKSDEFEVKCEIAYVMLSVGKHLLVGVGSPKSEV